MQNLHETLSLQNKCKQLSWCNYKVASILKTIFSETKIRHLNIFVKKLYGKYFCFYAKFDQTSRLQDKHKNPMSCNPEMYVSA